MRNEFIGLKLLDVLKSLRGHLSSSDDLHVQLDVFDEQKESDEAHVEGPHDVDLNSHLDSCKVCFLGNFSYLRAFY